MKATRAKGKEGAGASVALLDDASRRYRKPLNAFFGRRTDSDHQLCEDLTQEVFVRVAGRQSVDEIRDVDRYLFRAAANVLRDHFRRGRAGGQRIFEPYEENLHAAENFSPERVLLGKEQAARALAAIEALPERARLVVILSRFEGLKRVEIAERMGISVSAVEKHLQLCMARISVAMKDIDHGFAPDE